MIRLNLTAAPEWLELAPGLRLQVAPLTTALMVSARADATLEALPDDASQEELALVMAKAVARRAVLDWEGVGDAMGRPALMIEIRNDLIDTPARAAAMAAHLEPTLRRVLGLETTGAER